MSSEDNTVTNKRGDGRKRVGFALGPSAKAGENADEETNSEFASYHRPGTPHPNKKAKEGEGGMETNQVSMQPPLFNQTESAALCGIGDYDYEPPEEMDVSHVNGQDEVRTSFCFSARSFHFPVHAVCSASAL
jgi:hypothetical protein